MQRRSMLVVVLAGCCALPAARAQTREMQFGPLAMQWPEGYTIERPAEPVVLVGPQAQHVWVSVHRPDAGPAGPAGVRARAAEVRRLVQRSTRLVQAAAEGYGTVVVPVARTALPDGSTLLSAASQAHGASKYLLQYNVIGPRGAIAYLTVEGGAGSPSAEYQRLLPLFASAHWLP